LLLASFLLALSSGRRAEDAYGDFWLDAALSFHVTTALTSEIARQPDVRIAID